MKHHFVQFSNEKDSEIYLLREDTILALIVRGVGNDLYAIDAETETCVYPLFEGTLEETTGRYIKLCKEAKITATKVYL